MAIANPDGESLAGTDTVMQTYAPSVHPPYDPLEIPYDEPYDPSVYDKQQPTTA